MTALGDALRSKFRTPKEALAALGLDESLLTASKEPQSMSKIVLSRKAALTYAGLIGYLRPKMATDAKLNLAGVFKGVDAKNYLAKKPAIVAEVTKIVTPLLAKDANLEDMHKFMDRLDGEEPNEAIDEQSPTTGEVSDADPEANLRKFIKDRKMSKDAVRKAWDEMDPEASDEETEEEKKAKEAKDRRARDKAAKDKAARDASETEEEKKDREAKEAKDKRAKDEESEKEKTKAMDAAIKTATKIAVESAIAEQRAIREAERDVRGHVGELAMDHKSAADVYRTALTSLGEDAETVKDLDVKAMRAILKHIPTPGSNRPAPRLGADAAGAASAEAEFRRMFPTEKPLIRI